MFNPYRVEPGDTLRLLNESIDSFRLPSAWLATALAFAREDINIYLEEQCVPGLYLNRRSCVPTHYLDQGRLYQNGLTAPNELIPNLPVRWEGNDGKIIYFKQAPPLQPSEFAMTTEMVRAGLMDYLYEKRPWMRGVIPDRRYIDYSLPTQQRLNAYSLTPELQAFLRKYPTRLLRIQHDINGLIILVLCDIRVYLWTQQQENTYV